MINVFAHTTYIGNTGYNNHSRSFFRHLSKYCNLKIRNFTVGNTWKGMNDTPHDDEPYINDSDKKILFEQTLWNFKKEREDYKIYPSTNKFFEHDVNIILSETGHYYFYDNYSGPKIAYNVWESTEQPYDFFNKLKEFDEVWVPSEWQKECTIKQGISADKVSVVPEGVDDEVFFPEEVELLPEYSDGRFKFLLFGRWDYRKSTKEIIETFIKTFDKKEPVDLVVSIDNPFGKDLDGFESTEERLSNYGLLDDRIKIKHFPSREDYISYLKTGHVFVSCARSEGWNLPLIESMSCGIPSIYSECSGQMEFAEGKGLPVKIIGEKKADSNEYARFKMTSLPGNYYEPDFNHLSKVMRDSYENYEFYKNKSLKESVLIREKFNWDNVSKIGYDRILSFLESYEPKDNHSDENKIKVTYTNGPKVEVIGNSYKEYYVEFIDDLTNTVIHSGTIKNNMWINCGRIYYTKWKIRINGEDYETMDLFNKKVHIHLDSKSIGDTIAWTPFVVDFQKEHGCDLYVTTFHNEWFKGNKNYDKINFIEPGKEIECYAKYNIGWFKDNNNKWEKFTHYPNRLNKIPLQQTATDILGLSYKETNYGVEFKLSENPINEKYVIFAPQSTAGCKEWVYDNWVELSQMFIKSNYKVVILTKNPYYIENCINVWDKDFDTMCNYLYYSDYFVGLGSGLSWLNWSLNKFTYMINGFSIDGHEFSERIKKINNNSCIRCWNDPVHTFDAGDWDWCPVYKGSKLQHICQKSITSTQVYNDIFNNENIS